MRLPYCYGDVVVLSPELLGARDKPYGDFIAGNRLNEPLTDILRRSAVSSRVLHGCSS